MSKEIVNDITFERLDNDINGNPRYVFHWLNLSDTYESAIKKAHEFGGRKYNNKKYGGGIVIQSYTGELKRYAELITAAKAKP
jgi:hypothetical protein